MLMVGRFLFVIFIASQTLAQVKEDDGHFGYDDSSFLAIDVGTNPPIGQTPPNTPPMTPPVTPGGQGITPGGTPGTTPEPCLIQKNEIVTLNRTAVAFQEESKRLQLKLAECNVKVTGYESSIRTKDEDILKLKNLVRGLQSNASSQAITISQLTGKMNGQAVSIQKLTANLSQCEGRSQAQALIIQQKVNEITGFKQQLKNQNTTMVRQTQEIRRLTASENKMKGEKAELEKNMKTTEEENKNLTLQLGQLRNQLNREKQENKTCQKNERELKECLKHKQDCEDKLRKAVTPVKSTCPPPSPIDRQHSNCWLRFRDSFYIAVHEKKSIHEAREHCNKMGAHLIKINDQDEMDFMKSVVINTDNIYWWFEFGGPRPHQRDSASNMDDGAALSDQTKRVDKRGGQNGGQNRGGGPPHRGGPRGNNSGNRGKKHSWWRPMEWLKKLAKKYLKKPGYGNCINSQSLAVYEGWCKNPKYFVCEAH